MKREEFSDTRLQNIEDIPAKAGVSRVINNKPVVSEAAHRKVLDVIKQEDFAPNPVARALRTRRTNVIGVIIPQLPQILFDDVHYFPALLRGISRVANEHDYTTLLWFAQSEDDEQRFYNRIITNRLTDGVIIASARQNSPLVDHFLRAYTPFVLVERPAHSHDRISCVTIDNFAAAHQVVSHLLALGRKRIGTITGNTAIADGADRLAGYRQALLDAGRPIDDTLICGGNVTYQAGYDGMKQLIQRGVDAVFAACDVTARGTLQAVLDAGLKVPQDIAIVSIDDLPPAAQITSQLTTTHHPIEENGAYAAETLFNLIEGQATAPRQILLPTWLIIREACGARLA